MLKHISEIPNHIVLEVLNIEQKKVLLLNWDELPFDNQIFKSNNVLCFCNDGLFQWVVTGMKDTGFWDDVMDTFTGIRTDGEDVILTSFYGNAFNLDVRKGRVSYREMTK